MSVLVTGGGGYIGSHMVWNLVDADERVVVLDNLTTGFAWAIAPEAMLVEGDIADQPLVERLIEENEVDAIIHFAGSIIVPEIGQQPLGLLSQQHRQVAGADRIGGPRTGAPFHLLLDGGGLRHAGRAFRSARMRRSAPNRPMAAPS